MVLSECLSQEQIKAFALGELSVRSLDRITAHMDACPTCEASLQHWDHHQDSLVDGLRGLDFDSQHDEAATPVSLVELAVGVKTDPYGPTGDLPLDPGQKLAHQLEEGTCRLGKFELQAELGVGSFGFVFRAYDTELDRIVALKVQRAGRFASKDEADRFLREARNAAQLKHAGIISIYETGQTEDGVCFLVTEYIAGETLEDLIKRGPIDQKDAVRLIAEVCDALSCAHSCGVFHRDLKPSNILLDVQERPHIADFGLAKRDTCDTITSDGRIMGTPAYMSPEQARGDSHHVDSRSDTYSLGVILYELVTGERPFQGNRRLLLLQVLEDEPRSPRLLNPNIDRDVGTICLKAMAKPASRRYASSAEFGLDLRRYLSNEPIKARPVGYRERLWRWCQNNPFAVLLIVAVLLSSFAGFLYLSNLSKHYVHATALNSIRMEADMLEKINEFYSEKVVGRLDWDQIKVTHEYLTTPNSLPLPFTFMIDAGQQITENRDGMEVRIYSNHPWRKNGGPKDEFERHALNWLTKEFSNTDERSYHGFVDDQDKSVLRYARAQVMKESCVKCHNSHLQSPKKNWKVGEVVGVLAINRSLDRDIERTRSGFRKAFLLMCCVTFGLIALSLTVLVGSQKGSHLVK